MSESLPSTHRSLRLDALRGVAVIGMIVAHAIFFFHTNTDPTLVLLERFLNTTVFTLFVFVSGLSISRYMDTHFHLGQRAQALSVLKRAGLFYVAYVITALVALVTTTPVSSVSELIAKIPGVVTMLAPPSFTEYMPLFILLSLCLYPMWKVFHFTRQSIVMTVITGGLAYTLGILFFPLNLNPTLEPIKELFVGGGTTLRFPLLFYIPVFLWGLWWQHSLDHVVQDAKIFGMRLTVIVIAAAITIGGMIVAFWYYIPILDPGTRWPPSIGYLATGLVIAAILTAISPTLQWIGQFPARIIVYVGRDALDLWISHLLILFLYRRFVGTQFVNIGTVFLLTILLLATSIILSALRITNRVAFPMRFTLEGTSRFRIRYVIFALITGAVLILSYYTPILRSSTYGSFMLSTPLIVQRRQKVHVSTDRTWYTRHIAKTDSIEITIKAETGTEIIPLTPDAVTVTVGSIITKPAVVQEKDGSVHYSLLVNDIPPGEYPITAAIGTGSTHVVSNTATIFVSEPFLVAWTFDWEGWDVSDSALQNMEQYEADGDKHFTHFVNPRMFLPDVLTPGRRATLTEFLQKRQAGGDEIALHIHMQFDLVRAAGLVPRTTHPWGLLTSEGYDVPMTEYTPEEFRRILIYAKNLTIASGMPVPRGFRAGGWFMSQDFLKILSEEHFAYDSSGRDRPAIGPFHTTPWDLPVGAQPYIPTTAPNLLEIPDDGISTSELTSQEFIDRAHNLYPGGILTTPKTFVVISHPQFAVQEFPRIPQVLTTLTDESYNKDAGPVVFVTISDIYNLWTTSFLH